MGSPTAADQRALDGLNEANSTATTSVLSRTGNELLPVTSSDFQNGAYDTSSPLSLAAGAPPPAPLPPPARPRKIGAASTPHSCSSASVDPAEATATPVYVALLRHGSLSRAACKPAPGRGMALRPAAPLRATHLLLAALASCAPPHMRRVHDETCLLLPRRHADMQPVSHDGCDEPLAAAAAVATGASVVCDAPWHAPHAQGFDEGVGSATRDGRAGTSSCARRSLPMPPPARQHACGAKTAPRRATAAQTRDGTRGRAVEGGGAWVVAPSLTQHGQDGRSREEKTQERASPPQLSPARRVRCPPSLPHPFPPSHSLFRKVLFISPHPPLPPCLPSRRSATLCQRQRSTARSAGGGARASSHRRPVRRGARPCLAAANGATFGRQAPYFGCCIRRSQFTGGVWRRRRSVPRCSSALRRRPGGVRRMRSRRVCRAAAAQRSGDRGGEEA